MSEPAQPGVVPTCYRHPDREAYIKCQRCGRVICPDCMRDSAVGFQCPECVKEGSRSTRSGRTAYGGLRPSNAGITSMVIIGINIAVWVAILATGGRASRLLDYLGLRPNGLCCHPWLRRARGHASRSATSTAGPSFPASPTAPTGSC